LRIFSRPRLMSMAEAPLFAGPTPIIRISINWMKRTPAGIAGKVSAVPLEPCLLLSTWRVISPAAARQVAGCARPVWNSTFAAPALAPPTFPTSTTAPLAPTTFRLTLNHNVSFPFGFRGITRFPLCYYGATPKNKPVHQIRQGAVSASIWRQQIEKGPMFNVTFQRSYKGGETWKSSTRFGRNNPLVLSLVAARAFEWIGNQPRTLKL
jgi:hypothetical protein